MALTLYELCGPHDVRYSQFSWRTRLALAHKGLTYEAIGVRISDKSSLAFSRQEKVPVLIDGEQVIADSWAIAEHLEATHAHQPSLFGCEIGKGVSRFVNAWTDRQIIPRLAPLMMVDVVNRLDKEDATHLRQQIEGVFGKGLEELSADRETKVGALRKLLDPARAILRQQPFLCGNNPAYADYVLFSVFQWCRIMSAFDPLENDKPLAEWRERVLDQFEGFARVDPAPVLAST